MTTEQQETSFDSSVAAAREALKRLFYAAGMVPAGADMKIVADFITQAAADKRRIEEPTNDN